MITLSICSVFISSALISWLRNVLIDSEVSYGNASIKSKHRLCKGCILVGYLVVSRGTSTPKSRNG